MHIHTNMQGVPNGRQGAMIHGHLHMQICVDQCASSAIRHALLGAALNEHNDDTVQWELSLICKHMYACIFSCAYID